LKIIIIKEVNAMHKKILVPTDGSGNAEKAGEYAISLANISGAEILFLYVIDTDYINSIRQHDLREQMDKDLMEEGKKAVNKFEAKIEDKKSHISKLINTSNLIKEGKPADVILKTIEEEDIDQVVMGKCGKHGIEKLITGSTTEKVLSGATIPVNIIS
jgi:nucleotide-binding universal stress UspA family protein